MGIYREVKDRIGKTNNHYYLGDLHLFVRGYPIRSLTKLIDIIDKDPYATFSLGGDTCDSMNIQDPRYKMGQYEGRSELIDAQIDLVEHFFGRIADKCLWVLYGNHEKRVWNITDIAKRIARRLNCDCYEPYTDPKDRGKGLDKDPNARSVMMMKVDFGPMKILNGHWEWYVNSMANDDYIAWENERRSLKKRMCKVGWVDDCEGVVCHHNHKLHIIEPTKSKFMKMVSTKSGKAKAVYPMPTKIWIDKKNNLYYYDRDDRWYGSSGGFLPAYVDGFSTYAEEKGYKATEMGCVVSQIREGKFIGFDMIKL